MTRTLDSAVLLTREGVGHGSYGTNSCVNAAVDATLIRGTRPADGTVCKTADGTVCKTAARRRALPHARSAGGDRRVAAGLRGCGPLTLSARPGAVRSTAMATRLGDGAYVNTGSVFPHR